MSLTGLAECQRVCVTPLSMWHSPGLSTADVAAAALLSPLAWPSAVLSVPDMAVCWEHNSEETYV